MLYKYISMIASGHLQRVPIKIQNTYNHKVCAVNIIQYVIENQLNVWCSYVLHSLNSIALRLAIHK